MGVSLLGKWKLKMSTLGSAQLKVSLFFKQQVTHPWPNPEGCCLLLSLCWQHLALSQAGLAAWEAALGGREIEPKPWMLWGGQCAAVGFTDMGCAPNVRQPDTKPHHCNSLALHIPPEYILVIIPGSFPRTESKTASDLDCWSICVNTACCTPSKNSPQWVGCGSPRQQHDIKIPHYQWFDF